MNSKKRHGIHSPFVYEISDFLSKKKISKALKSERKGFYKNYLEDKTTISITDFGAGSKKMENKRRICDIFKNSSSRGKTANFLYKLSLFAKPQRILELGTSLGVGTFHLKKGCPTAELITIEACENTLNKAKEGLIFAGIKADFHLASFEGYIKDEIAGSFDIIYIDGHHDGNALLRYITLLLPYATPETMFIIDDIRWSKSMYDAWEKVINSVDFHVTIDFFRFGIAFQRKHQEKEHFVLR
ncbi:MAG: class I SAM-dependent methyltransferase [Crocinitomicaceae bacterium]|nr:class I SAM-dependent methyltransferase [Crocinitomicaceae bacterium]